MKKFLVVLVICSVILFGVAACTSTETIALTTAPSPDQTGTAESVKAAADASFLSTEEANTVLETAAAATETAAEATETQLALLATDTPTTSPSPIPTLTPMPTSTPATYLFPFSNTLPIEWEGWIDGESILQIEEIVANGFFSGNFTSGREKYAFSGKIVESIPEYELGKWEQIDGFEPDLGGTWIRFTNYSVIEGNGPTDQLFFAHVNENGEMRGVFFWNKNTFEPFNSFELFLTNQ